MGTKDKMLISVVIPTFQAENQLSRLLEVLSQQTIHPVEIIIIDSSSMDNTIRIAQEAKCKLILIDRNEFRHAGTRNLAARQAIGDYLIFLTQDALPANQFFIERLINPICEGRSVASYARQIAYPNSNPIEIFSRLYNYTDKNMMKTSKDVKTLGVKAYFFSDSASAISREVFWSVGGFSEKVIVNEDMYLCAQLLQRNHSIAYQAEAVTYHSHNYSFIQLFRRYFDIGVFFAQTSDELNNAGPQSEGLRFVRYGVKYLASNQAWLYVPRFMIESVVKFIAIKIGLHQHFLPTTIKRKFSGQDNYWQ